MNTLPAAARGLTIVLLAGVLVACAPAEAGERPTPKVAATAAMTPGVTTTGPTTATVAHPTTQPAPSQTALEAASTFADAMVSGDLTALTLSFSPTGLAQARSLASQSGVEGAGGVTSAKIHSAVQLSDATPTWDIVLALSAEEGDSSLSTRWRWFPGAGWRIVALEPGSR